MKKRFQSVKSTISRSILQKKRILFYFMQRSEAILLPKKYGVTDPDILNAILNHTTGRPDMSLLEKIVWLSDYIEPSRKQAPNLPEIRRIAFENLDKALVMALENTLSYLKGGNMEIDSMTQKTYDFYKNGGNV